MDDILYIVNNSDNVKVNESKLFEITQSIYSVNFEHWSVNNSVFNSLSENEKIIFVFILESLNFCFWPTPNWKLSYKGNIYTGSYALLYSLIKAVEENKLLLTVNGLDRMSRDKFEIIFKHNSVLPAMFNERYASFTNFVETIQKIGLENLINELYSLTNVSDFESYIVQNFKTFDDKCSYKGREIHFNKRCRLLISDLFHIDNTIKNNITDICSMLGCADYRIPEYFYEKGVFVYSDDLENTIKNKEDILYGDFREIEIRAATLYSLEKIADILKKRNHNITTIELDNIIWSMSRFSNNDFAHHTRSIYY